jgi:hypothetical protein
LNGLRVFLLLVRGAAKMKTMLVVWALVAALMAAVPIGKAQAAQPSTTVSLLGLSSLNKQLPQQI